MHVKDMCITLECVLFGREAARQDLRGKTVREVRAALPFVLSAAARISPVLMTPCLPPPNYDPPVPSSKQYHAHTSTCTPTDLFVTSTCIYLF